LRSDGESDQVLRFVLDHPEAFPDLLEALDSENRVIRGRAADALEKVARERPGWVAEALDRLIPKGRHDPAVTVRMHVAMAYGHLACDHRLIKRLSDELKRMLREESRAFVLSWAIASLAIIASLEPNVHSSALSSIAALRGSDSIAVRTRAETALAVLTDRSAHFPDGWVKSETVQAALAGEEV
jgi:HEAT repeat protein